MEFWKRRSGSLNRITTGRQRLTRVGMSTKCTCGRTKDCERFHVYTLLGGQSLGQVTIHYICTPRVATYNHWDGRFKNEPRNEPIGANLGCCLLVQRNATSRGFLHYVWKGIRNIRALSMETTVVQVPK